MSDFTASALTWQGTPFLNGLADGFGFGVAFHYFGTLLIRWHERRAS